jgi:predicted nucleotidyltransferase
MAAARNLKSCVLFVENCSCARNALDGPRTCTWVQSFRDDGLQAPVGWRRQAGFSCGTMAFITNGGHDDESQLDGRCADCTYRVMNAPMTEMAAIMAAWAEARPRVRRVWLFGSRVKGTQRRDSDVDVAVEIEPVADSEESLLVWLNNGERWRGELEQEIGLLVNLEWFDPDGSTPNVQGALREASVLIYDRAGAR